MAIGNQMGGWPLVLPRQMQPMAEPADFKKRREKGSLAPAGTVPSTGNRQDLF